MDDLIKELKLHANLVVPVTLTLIKTKHTESPLRTTKVDGVVVCPPVVGFGYFVLAPALIGPGTRQVTTSVVQSISWDIGGFTLETMNSHYDVRVHDKMSELEAMSNMLLALRINEGPGGTH